MQLIVRAFPVLADKQPEMQAFVNAMRTTRADEAATTAICRSGEAIVKSIFVGAVVVLSVSASMAAQTHRTSIVHERDLPPYSPPAHSDTVNRRLVGGDFARTYELIHGTIAAGGEAEAHQHERESQVVYVLSGQAQVTLGTDQPANCLSGDVIKIPPGLRHHVVNTGTVPLELIIVYSPPLPASGALQR